MISLDREWKLWDESKFPAMNDSWYLNETPRASKHVNQVLGKARLVTRLEFVKKLISPFSVKHKIFMIIHRLIMSDAFIGILRPKTEMNHLIIFFSEIFFLYFQWLEAINLFFGALCWNCNKSISLMSVANILMEKGGKREWMRRFLEFQSRFTECDFLTRATSVEIKAQEKFCAAQNVDWTVVETCVNRTLHKRCQLGCDCGPDKASSLSIWVPYWNFRPIIHKLDVFGE